MVFESRLFCIFDLNHTNNIRYFLDRLKVPKINTNIKVGSLEK